MFTEITANLANDPWFKVVDFLQHNWAVIVNQGDSMLVVFYGDTCGVFDEIAFNSESDAVEALVRNGFAKYKDDENAQGYIGLPRGDFHEREHPNGRIYSSGRFWR